MSTRGVIARKDGTRFIGVYHHWDSYPSGLGATLYEIYHNVFNKDLGKMLKNLIDDHPAGWSTIVGADWSLKPGYVNPEAPSDYPCEKCGKPFWAHYRQYYKDHGLQTPPESTNRGCPACVFDHPAVTRKYQDAPKGPQCYCHGGRSENPQQVTDMNAAGMGCEYAYVFDEENGEMKILSSYHKDGTKAIGAFGSGDPHAEWHLIGSVNLDAGDEEPDWEKIERGLED